MYLTTLPYAHSACLRMLSLSASSAVSIPRLGAQRRTTVVVRAEAGIVNPDIKKDLDKVADMMSVKDLPKPKCVICRCWRSKKFPYCDGAHLAHNKATGDNVGPFVIDTKDL